MKDIKDLVWTEKFRPTSVDNVIGEFSSKIKKYLVNQQSIPNFLFYSKTPGTGKTTLAKAIINDLSCDSLILNASDDRKIEVIREKVKDFSVTVSSNGERKCCFFDEFDGMLKDSQNALRNLMETYSSNIFFILTCNNIQKVIEPIQSRCTTIEFTKPNKHDVYTYLENICKTENMQYTEEGIQKIISINYPSIRNCVLKLQDLFIENKDANIENVMSSRFNKEIQDIWNNIKNQKYIEVKQKIIEDNIDCEILNNYIFEQLTKGDLDLKFEIGIVPILARNERDFKLGADKNIIFIASVISIIKVLRG